jgi:hypothetical protein
MRSLLAPAVLAAAMAGGAAQAAQVEIDAAVRLTVIPEQRSDVKVEIVRTHPGLPLVVRTRNGGVRIEGGAARKIRECSKQNGRPVVHVMGVGEVRWEDLPQIVIRTPRDVDLGTGGAVFGTIGRAASVNLANAGCGDWTVANVDGALRISQASSGDARAGSAASAKLRLAGSGDITTAAIRGGAQIEMAGSGDVAMRSVSGPLDVRMAGSGDVTIDGGHAAPMAVSVAGSGNVTFRGVADALNARVAGSGDVRVKVVTGPVKKSIIGSGAVIVGAKKHNVKAPQQA